jgi:hypothetical protein
MLYILRTVLKMTIGKPPQTNPTTTCLNSVSLGDGLHRNHRAKYVAQFPKHWFNADANFIHAKAN